MAGFALHRSPKGQGLLLVIQSNLLDYLSTRVVVPLLPVKAAGTDMERLHPIFVIEERRYLMATQLMAALTISELGPPVGSLDHEHDRIMAALAMLISGY